MGALQFVVRPYLFVDGVDEEVDGKEEGEGVQRLRQSQADQHGQGRSLQEKAKKISPPREQTAQPSRERPIFSFRVAPVQAPMMV